MDEMSFYPVDADPLNAYVGLYNSAFSGFCFVDIDVTICSSILSNVIIERSSFILSCSNITCDQSTLYGLNESIFVGAESGGREISTYPGMHFQSCVRQAFTSNTKARVPAARLTTKLTVIGKFCCAMNCSSITNSILCDHMYAHSASLSTCVVLNIKEDLKSCRIEGGQITNVVMHSGCTITSSCILNNVYMFEHTSVGEFVRLDNVILGPDSSLAGGEVHHSLVGSFTGKRCAIGDNKGIR